jgi:hypothetical protein
MVLEMRMSDSFNGNREDLVFECATAYLFNFIYIADKSDRGGLDYPLEKPYLPLKPMVEKLLKEGVFEVADYEEAGETGQELVLGGKAEAMLEKLIQTSEAYMDQSCQGLDAVRQAYYLAMNEGKLSSLSEDEPNWVQKLLDFNFYESLVPDQPAVMSKPSAPSSPASNLSSPPPSRASLREPNLSAIELNERPDEANWPPKTYLFKKSTMAWAGGTVLSLFLANNGGALLWGLSALSAALTVFFAYRKVIVSSEELRFISLAGSKSVALGDIDEMVLKEIDGEISELNVISSRGDSIKISKWLDDLTGAYHLLRRFKNVK